jgi:hypothetical protein
MLCQLCMFVHVSTRFYFVLFCFVLGIFALRGVFCVCVVVVLVVVVCFFFQCYVPAFVS